MRRQLVSLTFAGLVTLLTAPMAAGAAPVPPDDTAAVPSPVAVQRVAIYPGLRDEAAMVLLGTALIGLAAAVRRVA